MLSTLEPITTPTDQLATSVLPIVEDAELPDEPSWEEMFAVQVAPLTSADLDDALDLRASFL